MFLLRWAAKGLSVPAIRWVLEACLLYVFEWYGAPRLEEKLPDAGLLFGVLLSAVLFLLEHSAHQTKVIKAEGQRVLSRVEELLRRGVFARMDQRLLDIDSHNKLVGSIILRTTPASPKGTQYFDRYYDDVVKKLGDIIDGRFTIIRETPEQIWKSHIYSLDRATPGIEFHATCLVPTTVEGTRSVFENEVFNEYCRVSYMKLKEGHLSGIKKIFIVNDRAMIAGCPCLMTHLNEIHRVSLDIGREKLAPRLIVFEELQRDGELTDIPQDFMIWGRELLVVSRMGAAHLLHGLECNTHEGEIDHKNAEFNRLFTLAKPLDLLFSSENALRSAGSVAD